MIRVTKKFTFDAAHLLPKHPGLCQNLHGHTYHVEVTLQAPHVNDAGMVADFGGISSAVKEAIISVYDHSCIINQHTRDSFELELRKFLEQYDKRISYIPGIVTAENMAKHFFNIVSDLCFGMEYQVVNVKVYETPTSFAEYDNVVSDC